MTSREAEARAYFEVPGRYLHKRSHVRLRALVVRDLVGNLEHLNIADLGCGDGAVSLQFLPGGNAITLVDSSAEMLEIARRQIPSGQEGCVTMLEADLADLEIPNGFDVVICLGVLAHVDSVGETIKRTAAVTAPNGRCVIQFTDCDRLLGRFTHRYQFARKRLARHGRYSLNRTGFREVDACASRSGLELVAERRYFPLLPGMGLVRDDWLFNYQAFTLRHRLLSEYGSETVLLYSKGR